MRVWGFCFRRPESRSPRAALPCLTKARKAARASFEAGSHASHRRTTTGSGYSSSTEVHQQNSAQCETHQCTAGVTPAALTQTYTQCGIYHQSTACNEKSTRQMTYITTHMNPTDERLHLFRLRLPPLLIICLLLDRVPPNRLRRRLRLQILCTRVQTAVRGDGLEENTQRRPLERTAELREPAPAIDAARIVLRLVSRDELPWLLHLLSL